MHGAWHLLTVLAAEAGGHEEKSKAAYYVLGGCLASWAVIVSLLGMRADFPANKGQQRLAILITAALVVGTMTSAVATG